MTVREELAERWPTTVRLNLPQLSAVLAAAAAGTRGRRSRDRDLNAALSKLADAQERRRRAVERAGGRK